MPDLFTILVVASLVTLSGLFSGLTLGLMSLNPFALKRKARLGNKHAKRIYPLRRNGNLLLITLLLGNVAVNAALSIFLGSIASGLIAGIAATSLIVIFGEIMPQATFARHALPLGARTIWIAYFFVIILYPLAKPMSLVLDKLLGSELPIIFSKKEVQMILKEHVRSRRSDIDQDEFAILEAGLEFSDKTVGEVMTPLKNAFCLSEDILLNKKNLADIRLGGHSRIPVFDRAQRRIRGVLYVKDLVGLDPDARTPAKRMMRRPAYFVRERDKLDIVLNLFREKRVHLFVVLGKKRVQTGIITLEDVLEEIVGEIVDEYDLLAESKTKKKKKRNLRRFPSSAPHSPR